MKLANNRIDTKDVVKRWNNGDLVWSIELGGIGLGYEQSIQITLFRILTYWMKKKIKPNSLVKDNKFTPDSKKPLYKLLKDLGLSGAQFGTARRAAFQFLKYGYKKMMKKCPKERTILVSKNFPK